VTLFIYLTIWLIVLDQFLFMMLAMVHPPSRSYIDPWTGQLFGEGGVENSEKNVKNPTFTGLEGGAIMGKLGNETAK